jgi:hypothetical protein
MRRSSLSEQSISAVAWLDMNMSCLQKWLVKQTKRTYYRHQILEIVINTLEVSYISDKEISLECLNEASLGISFDRSSTRQKGHGAIIITRPTLSNACEK